MKKITLSEIAQKAGVSIKSVSMVVNKQKGIGKETRERIERIIDELGYEPNIIARGLKTRSINIIGVLIPNLINPSWYELLEGIEKRLRQNNYHMLLAASEYNHKEEVKIIKEFNSMLIAGIILVPSYTEDRDISFFKKLNKPLILLDGVIRNLSVDTIVHDDINGATTAINYLLENNHKKIVHLAGKKDNYTAINRYKGYKKVMKAKHLFNEENVFWGEYSIESGYKMMIESLSKGKKIDAVFAGNDLIALGAKKAIEDKGLKVPEDISLVGFDNISFSGNINPPLTTIELPLEEMGMKAVKILFERIRKDTDKKFSKTKLKCRLIEGKSVRKK